MTENSTADSMIVRPPATANHDELRQAARSDVVIDLRTTPAVLDRAHPVTHSTAAAAAKRTIDIAVAGVVTLLLLPLLIVLAVMIKASDGGPITFRQRRCGQHGHVFEILKFRTMRTDAEEMLASNPELWARYLENDFKLGGADDPRVTRLGRFLRSSSLDELPQLWNVVRGEMSLVGPRPVVLGEIHCYAEHRAAYESVRPGMTGPWQVSGRNNIRYPERAELDAHYAHTWSVWGDLLILVRTPLAILRVNRVA